MPWSIFWASNAKFCGLKKKENQTFKYFCKSQPSWGEDCFTSCNFNETYSDPPECTKTEHATLPTREGRPGRHCPRAAGQPDAHRRPCPRTGAQSRAAQRCSAEPRRGEPDVTRNLGKKRPLVGAPVAGAEAGAPPRSHSRRQRRPPRWVFTVWFWEADRKGRRQESSTRAEG